MGVIARETLLGSLLVSDHHYIGFPVGALTGSYQYIMGGDCRDYCWGLPPGGTVRRQKGQSYHEACYRMGIAVEVSLWG